METGGVDAHGSQQNAARISELNKLLPVAVVILTIVFLYVEYVFLHCLRLLQLDVSKEHQDLSELERGKSQMMTFHIITGLLLFSFWRCVFTFPGTIPNGAGWDLHGTEDGVVSSNERGLTKAEKASLIEKKHTGERRHCKWCLKFKPDRCHHCRMCNVCVLKMDHHCPWVYNCIGFRNHKYFFLLLIYTAIDLVTITFTMFDSVWWSTRIDVNISVMLALLTGEILATFLMVLTVCFLCFHIWLMLNAMTTVEFCEKSLKKASYNSSIYRWGWYRNACAVLGDQPILWFLPFSFPTGDGTTWPANPAVPVVKSSQGGTDSGARSSLQS